LVKLSERREEEKKRRREVDIRYIICFNKSFISENQICHTKVIKASAELVLILEDEEKEEITNKSSSYCVSFVSMVDSIGFTFQIKDAEKIRKYYSIFINTMAAIARNFGAKIIKNTGTSLVYFFPKTSSIGDNQQAFILVR
jgi:chaperonin GroEL (HSP60 family)